jgi:hypothetical protein
MTIELLKKHVHLSHVIPSLIQSSSSVVGQPNIEKNIFWQNSIFLINIDPIEVDTTVTAVKQFFDTIFYSTISLWPQKILQFQLLTSSFKLNFLPASILLRSENLKIEKSHWGPDLENTVDGKAIRSLIHAISPSF